MKNEETAYQEARYERILLRVQNPDMLGRDLTRDERNQVRAWVGLSREVSETEQCA